MTDSALGAQAGEGEASSWHGGRRGERQRWEAEGGKSRGWGSRKRKLFLVLQGGIGTIVIKASF